jgi:hypothetical protein
MSNKVRIVKATIVDVNPKTHVAQVSTAADGGGIINDAVLGTPYAHARSGQGVASIPENGATCYLMYPSDNSPPVIVGYSMPTGPGEGEKGGRRDLNPGDTSITGDSRNFIITRADGTVEMGSNAASSIMTFPVDNLIRIVFENMEWFSTLGRMTWKSDKDSGLSGYELAVSTGSGETPSAFIRAGTSPASTHPGRPTNLPNKDIYLEFVVDPSGNGKLFGMHISADGSYSIETEANAAVVIKGSYQGFIDDSARMEIKTSAFLKAASVDIDTQEMSSTISGTFEVNAGTIALNSPTVRLGLGEQVPLVKADALVPILSALIGEHPKLAPLMSQLTQLGTTDTKAS